ncbi:hypothetical protein KJ859_02820 [Patescibacteria group bacterium]|nr:hypothetical protein [Patescibacteria group bacterium]
MTQNIPLKRLYDAVTTDFPQYNHNPQIFQQEIIDVLKQDPLRTRSLQKSISNEGLEFQLNRNFPLNDFLHGAREYLKHLGAPKKEAEKFERKYFKKDLLFE